MHLTSSFSILFIKLFLFAWSLTNTEFMCIAVSGKVRIVELINLTRLHWDIKIGPSLKFLLVDQIRFGGAIRSTRGMIESLAG